jgi:hypothetical protein
MSNDFSTQKFVRFNLIGGANTTVCMHFSGVLVFLIAYHVLTLPNKMVSLNVSTVIWLKPGLLSSLTLISLYVIGMKRFSPLAI